MPIEVMYGSKDFPQSSPSEYAKDLRERIEKAYNKVREIIGQEQVRQKDFYDKKVHGTPLEVGDLVFLHSLVLSRGHARKLHCPWTGPFQVVRRLTDSTYRIQQILSCRHRLVIHFDRLKRCPVDMRLPTPLPHSAPWH